MSDLRIIVGDEEFEAEWKDKNPETRKAIEEALPLEGSPSRWGKEFYFDIPVDVEQEDSEKVVERGDLAYWPSGNCFCIFWGPTPANPEEPEAASPVNVFASIQEYEGLDDLQGNPRIRVEKI